MLLNNFGNTGKSSYANQRRLKSLMRDLRHMDRKINKFKLTAEELNQCRYEQRDEDVYSSMDQSRVIYIDLKAARARKQREEMDNMLDPLHSDESSVMASPVSPKASAAKEIATPEPRQYQTSIGYLQPFDAYVNKTMLQTPKVDRRRSSFE